MSNTFHSALENLTGGPSRLVVLIDSSPLMALHRDNVATLVEHAARAGSPVVRFDAGHARGGHGPPWPLADPLPDGVDAAVIVTDAQDRGWRQRRFRAWVASVATRQPTALLHLLDRSVWSRGPLAPQPLRLTGASPSAPGARTPMTTADDAEDTAVPEGAALLPVLAFGPDSLAEWITVANGTGGIWRADAAVLPPDGARPPETVPWDPDPVSRFLAQASRGARELAVRLTQAPVNLPVAELLQRNLPHAPRDARAAVTEIAEVFGGDLVDPSHPLGDLDDPAAPALEFLPGVRRDLLGRFGDLSVMRSVLSSMAIEFKDCARVFQWLSRIETGAPRVTDLDGEEGLARALLPALSEMPGEYRRLAEHLRTALGETSADGAEHSTPPETVREEPTRP
nr:hypothetical protein [Nocardiopsis sp. CNR-923]